MRLTRLELFRFRNHSEAALSFEAPLQFFVGANAQGKTNLVEAIYVLATARSFRRNASTRDLLAHGADEASVRGSTVRDQLTTDLEVRLGKTRHLLVNGNEVSLLRDYVRHLSAVAFTPDDLTIVRGGPDVRREFVDRAAFTLSPQYLDEYTRYQRALAERNQLLKKGAAPGELEAWSEELAVTGANLARARAGFLDEFLPEAVAAFSQIFGGLQLRLAYEPNPSTFTQTDRSAWEDVLLAELREREIEDRTRGFTTAGPHRDDMSIELDGREARVYASQGQTRALALALRVAQIRHASAVLGASPLFILDDVGSELDETRRGFLADFLAASPVQAFITATDRNLLPPLEQKAQTWRLEGGRIDAA